MPHPIAARLALPLLSTLALSIPGDELELAPAPLAAGRELEHYLAVAYELDFELWASGETLPGFEMSYERITEKTVTVLEGGEEGPNAIRVVYHLVDELGEGPGIDGGDEIREENPLDGLVVDVRRDGSGWTALDGDETELEDELMSLVLDEEVHRGELLFALRMFAEAASTIALTEGSTVDVDEELAIELLDAAIDEDGGVFDEAEMILTFSGLRQHSESGARCAVFDVDLIASGEIPGDLELAVELAGELWLDLESACVTELKLEGEMAVAGDAEDVYGVELEGEGTFRLELRAF